MHRLAIATIIATLVGCFHPSDPSTSGTETTSTSGTSATQGSMDDGSTMDAGSLTTTVADTGTGTSGVDTGTGETSTSASTSASTDTGTSDGGGLCSNGQMDGDESDVDCGGSCMPCADGLSCGMNSDCLYGTCSASICGLACDPLLQDCAQGDGCYAMLAGYFCEPDDSGAGGAFGEPCDPAQPNSCDPGAFCVDESFVPTCAGLGACCTVFCDLSAPMCPDGLMCINIFAPGMRPPGTENAGGCGMAM